MDRLTITTEKAVDPTASIPSHSCAICEEILKELITPTIEWTDDRGFVKAEDINFGWLDSIIANNDCSLCRLTKRAFEQTRPSNWVAEGRIYCFISGGATRLTKAGKRKDWAIEYHFFYPGAVDTAARKISSLWEPTFQLVADFVQFLNLQDNAFQLGSVQSSTCPDLEFVHCCFETCRRDHGGLCNSAGRAGSQGKNFRPREKSTLPLGMRLIDTVENRIILAPSKCSYVILSYVWGTTNFLRLLTSNFEKMALKGALTDVDIPNTISNAIQITRALGERYLWVDSLCIIQDSEDEMKAIQIQNMDKIYSSAILTLVAADQNHADGGLWRSDPAMRRNYQQIVEKVGDLLFVNSAPNLENILENAPWTKRAWTFQEFMLSSRYLFFSDYQMYFSCQSISFAEDQVDRVDKSGIKQLQRGNDDESFGFISQAPDYSFDWSIVVREYTKRSLSYESDGLNAANGVLKYLAKGMKDDFICGLPMATLFEIGLLWYAANSLRRRGLAESGTLFPSWSWVGWVGEVRYEPFEESSAIAESRMIFEWSVEYDGVLLRSSVLNFPSADGRMTEAECTQQATESLKRIQSGILCFETMVASFVVDSTYWNQFAMSDDPDCLHNGLYKVYGADVWIGSVHLDHSVAKELPVGEGNLHEFVVVSKSGGKIMPYWVHTRPFIEDAEPLLLYSEELRHDDDEDVYNVLLVTKGERGTMRKGFGQIHIASFEKSNWISERIRLE
jgi:hypothetical protein